jgi:hypothetical protein
MLDGGWWMVDGAAAKMQPSAKYERLYRFHPLACSSTARTKAKNVNDYI